MDLLVAGLNGSGRLLGLHQGITVLRAQLRAARGRPRRQWRLTVDIIKARPPVSPHITLCSPPCAGTDRGPPIGGLGLTVPMIS